MSNESKKKIEEYLAKCPLINLGTVSPDGKPMVHTVGYASHGTTVYFVTQSDTRKAKNIANNPAVAYTADSDHDENWNEIQGVQMMGTAEVLTDKGEIEKAIKLLVIKFPQMANMPPDPKMIFIKVNPVEAYYLDNTVKFGHRDRVEY